MSPAPVAPDTVEHVVTCVAALLTRADRRQWRDAPDLRGRYPGQPHAPRLFADPA